MSEPLPPAANVLKVVVSGLTDADRPWANVLHWKWSGAAPTEASLNAFCGDVASNWNSFLIPIQNEAVTQTAVTAVDLTSDTGASGAYEAINTGALTGDQLPGGIAVLAQYSVGLRYRGGHPRQYLQAGQQGDLNDQSTWTSDFVASCGTAWGDFLTNTSGLTIEGMTIGAQVIVSYYTALARREDSLTLPVTFTGISATIASQRRRTRRRS